MPFVAPSRQIDFQFKFTPLNETVKFPAYIDSISANFTPTWTTYKETGRADQKVAYTKFEKTISLSFKVVAEDTSINTVYMFRRLEQLVRGASPMYYGPNLGYNGNFAYFTLGNLYVQRPVFITSLQYTWNNSEVTWDVGNIRNQENETGSELPMWTDVSMEMTWIGKRKPNQTHEFFRNRQ
jgi:hypothetical protein